MDTVMTRAGNMLYDGVHHYTYDAENRLLTVDGGASSYVYDAAGQRVRKKVGSVSVDYLYDTAGHEITEVNSASRSVSQASAHRSVHGGRVDGLENGKLLR